MKKSAIWSSSLVVPCHPHSQDSCFAWTLTGSRQNRSLRLLLSGGERALFFVMDSRMLRCRTGGLWSISSSFLTPRWMNGPQMNCVHLRSLHVQPLILRGPVPSVSPVSPVLHCTIATHRVSQGLYVIKSDVGFVLNGRPAREIQSEEYEAFSTVEGLQLISRLRDFPLTRSLVELMPNSAIRIRCIRQESFRRMHVALEDMWETFRGVTLLTVNQEGRWHMMRVFVSTRCARSPSL